MATKLVVIVFEGADDAQHALDDLKVIEKEGQIEIDDFAIIKKDPDGKVYVHNTTPSGAKKGAVAGSMLGLILAGIFFPIAGIAIGAAGGALIGKSIQLGIDKEFVKEVVEKLQPGTSALFITGERGAADVAIRVMDPYKGTVYHTNLDEDVADQLRQALKSSE
jgi:uncharacterized membrane protein